MSGPEVGNTLSGRKRSCSESIYSCLMDRVHPEHSDSLESSCLNKMFGQEVFSGLPERFCDGEVVWSTQRPPRPTSLMLHRPLSGRLDSPISQPQQLLPKNPRWLLHASRSSQAGTYFDMISSYMYKDASAVATVISQSVRDEGSQTSIKGSGVISINNPVRMACERKSTGFLPRPKASQAMESEPSNVVRQYTRESTGRQMTIFYSGQAHVFDNVHPDKADMIMALARSTGESWSTAYSSSEQTIMNETNNVPTLEEVRDVGHGLNQIAEIPLAIDLSGVTSGACQSGMVSGDVRARLMTPAAEPNVEDKRNA